MEKANLFINVSNNDPNLKTLSQSISFNLTENMLSLFSTLSTNKKHVVLSNLKSKKYSALGGASSKVLKSCVEQIAQSPTDIVNCSHHRELFPKMTNNP